MGVIGQTILPWWSTKLNLYYFDFRFFISNIDIYPFIKYLLGTILEVYKDFENRFSLVETELSALEMVRKASMYKIGRFNKQDIRELCPTLSNSSIEKAFRDLISLGEIKKEGKGKNTNYYRLK